MSVTVHQHDLILAGRREPGSAEPIEVVYPYTGEVVARVGAASRADVDRAIDAAVAAFRLYRDVPAHPRAALLAAVSQLVAERREELARDITYETGKAIWEARLEIDRAVNTFRIAGEEAVRIDWRAVREAEAQRRGFPVPISRWDSESPPALGAIPGSG